MIASEKIGGVYVIPSFGNSLCKLENEEYVEWLLMFCCTVSVWYGVIFVRQGFYEDGVLRFNVSLPDKFPEDSTVPVCKLNITAVLSSIPRASCLHSRVQRALGFVHSVGHGKSITLSTFSHTSFVTFVQFHWKF